MVRPLSVIDGSDADVIPIILEIHAPKTENLKILDVTYNTGKMWRKLNYQPIKLDIDQTLAVDLYGDFKRLPFIDNSLDVIVFDPPHLPNAALLLIVLKSIKKVMGLPIMIR